MIVSKTVYETNDGIAHATYRDATAYIEDKVQSEIDWMLKPASLSSHRDIITVVTFLAGDINKIKHLYDILGTWLRGIDSADIEEDTE
jgi:hypothetical protein